MTPELFKSLLTGYYTGTLTDKEKRDLSALLHDPQYRLQLEQLFTEDLADPAFRSIADTESLELMYQQIQLKKQAAPIRRLHAYRIRWAVAAAVALLIASGAYFLFFSPSQKTPIVYTPGVLKNDVTAPAYTKAVLLLSNGKEVILDSTVNGQLAVQENINIIKTGDGQLVYQVNSSLPAAGASLTNTLTVPRGSRPLQLILTDGTRVWINTASSITYPVAFTGNERKVQMNGEIYYEVAKDPAKKFYVSANGMETEVLGTHFNVNAYEDETTIKITLLEGSINVSAAGNRQHLAPNQQAQWKNGDKIKVLDDVDTGEVLAWKEGFFDFNSTDIHSVMRQLSRWYNVDVEYEGKNTDNHFSGIINRSNNVSQVLKMLQSTGGASFKIETDSSSARRGKIIVLPR